MVEKNADSLPVEAGLFALTRWSLVKRAAAGDESALSEWLTIYWYPLYAWARRRGMSPEDAKDAVQGFLAGICARKALGQADESKGRLRSWLLTAFTNFLTSAERKALREKRGAGAEHLAIDWSGAESAYLNEPGLLQSPEEIYARTWAATLLEEGIDVVAKRYAEKGQSALFAALLPAIEGPLKDTTYREVAQSLGMKEDALRTAAVTLRARYKKALMQVAAVRLGITNEEQLGDELRELLR